jgi:hypothetical protein
MRRRLHNLTRLQKHIAYDFGTRKVTQVTQLQNEFTGAFSISPDGQWIVFERSKTLDDNRAIDAQRFFCAFCAFLWLLD